MACKNLLEVDKTLIWTTKLPYKDEPRTSPVFSFMGSDWCLRFLYIDNFEDYHSIFLYQLIDGKISLVEKRLNETFRVEVYMMPITENYNVVKDVEVASVRSTKTYLWRSGKVKDKIFKTLSWLYDCPEVKFGCRFLGNPPPIPQLRSEAGTAVGTVESHADGPSDLECLSSDLGRLLENRQLPDMRIDCGGRSFPAHRSVLAARSEVFAAMFRNNMAESRTGVVDLKDADPDVVRHFLNYLYRGKLTAGSGNEVASLYSMADKYAVDSLKRACARWIAGGLTEGNCIEYLSITHYHGNEALKKAVFDFICAHPDVMLDAEWAELTRRNPDLALEAHRCFVRSKTTR